MGKRQAARSDVPLCQGPGAQEKVVFLIIFLTVVSKQWSPSFPQEHLSVTERQTVLHSNVETSIQESVALRAPNLGSHAAAIGVIP